MAVTPATEPWRIGIPISRDIHTPVLAKDILRYGNLSLFGVPSLAPAVAMAKAEAAERALRLLSSSRHDVITTPLLKLKSGNSVERRELTLSHSSVL